jgi:hypothetical protein
MQAADLHDQIDELEARVEALSEIAESCRKWIWLAKVISAAVAIWLLAGAIGILRFELLETVVAISAALGGVVLYGSNVSTLRGTREAIDSVETQRVQLIDSANLPSLEIPRRPTQSC